MQLTCDDCGSIQPDTNARCELCGGSLSEERQRGDQRSLIALLFGTVMATVVFFFVPAVLIHWRYFDDTTPLVFGAGYLLVWLVLTAIGRLYQPQDDYDIGYRGRGGYVIDNPFTLRDDRDRAHLGLGLVLFPVNVVGGLWATVFVRFFR